MNARLRQILAFACIATACSAAEPAALADDRATAANFFDAGAQAYDAGQYLVAAEAFLAAHALVKSPALQFSAAQAYRRQFLADSSTFALRHAVQLYREYLRDDPSGKRREDAMNALTDLVPIEARLRGRRGALVPIPPSAPAPPSSASLAGTSVPPTNIPPTASAGAPSPPAAPPETFEGDAEEPAPEPPRKTRLLVSAKPETAEVSIDGGAFVKVPAVVEVKPGAHAVRARAAGYFDDEFSLDAIEHELVPRHIALRPKAGRLMIAGTAGADVAIDGQLRARLPLERPMELEPGEHFVAISRAGYWSLGQTLRIERDRERRLQGDLEMTRQRFAAWSTLAVGAAGAAAGGVLGGLMLGKEATVSEMEAKRQGGTMAPGDIAMYNTTLRQRNTLATAAAITAGASALVLLTSAGMFLFDSPETLPVPQRKPDVPPSKSRVELTVGLSAASVRMSF